MMASAADVLLGTLTSARTRAQVTAVATSYSHFATCGAQPQGIALFSRSRAIMNPKAFRS